MTVRALYRLLGNIVANGYGRMPIVVDKSTFNHPLESDGCTNLDVLSCGTEWIFTMDDDGGVKTNKDGSERGTTMLVLRGEKSQ